MIHPLTLRFACLWVLLHMAVWGQAQAPRPLARLDLALQGLLAAQAPGAYERLNPQSSARLAAEALAQGPWQLDVRPTADGQLRYGVVVHTAQAAALAQAGLPVHSVYGQVVTTQVTAAELARLAELPEVQYVSTPRWRYTENFQSLGESGVHLLHDGAIDNTPYTGQNVLVMVYDSGIDWQHLDFRDPDDPSRSRIVFLWDQTLTALAGETAPAPFGYGVEYSRAQLEAGLAGTGNVRSRAFDGHGTHVAGTAAGNGAASWANASGFPGRSFGKHTGVAPQADLLIVKGGEGSFTEARIIDGLSYAQARSASLGRPIVCNFSLGSDFGAHDGTDAEEVAIDDFSAAGRIVVKSAGNSGRTSTPIHITGTLSSATPIAISVPNYIPTTAGGTFTDGFGLLIFFDGNPSVTAAFDPAGSASTVSVSNGQSFVSSSGNEPSGYIQIQNSQSTANGKRFVDLFFGRRNSTSTPPASGTWTLTLSGTASTTYHGWIYRNDIRSVTGQRPSIAGADNAYTISVPGTSRQGITVGAYSLGNTSETSGGWASIDGNRYNFTSTPLRGLRADFSSRGPSADGRTLPDISAPGQAIISVLSRDETLAVPDDDPLIPPFTNASHRYWVLQGTSMSSPHMAGIVALMLQANPNLTSDQIKDNLALTARRDAQTGDAFGNDFGRGKVDAFRALAHTLVPNSPARHWTVNHFSPTSGSAATRVSVPLTGTRRMATRISTTEPATVGGCWVTVAAQTAPAGEPTPPTPIVGTGNLVVEVFTNNAGVPGTRIGNAVTVPLPSFNHSTRNYVSLMPAGAEVTSGDFFIVLSVANPANSLRILHDNGNAPTDRSLVFTGSSWQAAGAAGTDLVAGADLALEAVLVSGGSVLTDVTDAAPVADQLQLLGPAPNPVRNTTLLTVQAAHAEPNAQLTVIDPLGRPVATLHSGPLSAGNHLYTWDARAAAPGVYVARLLSGSTARTVRMLVTP